MKSPSIRTIEDLENELHFLKQKQKKYNYLGGKMTQLQTKSKYISKEAQQMGNIITLKQLDEQQKVKALKLEIEQTLVRNRNLENQRNKIQQQINFSSIQLDNLQQLLEKIQVSNREKKVKVDIKQQQMKQYRVKLQKLREQSCSNQTKIAFLRHQIKQLQNQTGKYSVQIEAVRLRRKEQEKVCEKLRQQIRYNEAKINILKRQIEQEKGSIREYGQTKRAIKQAMAQYQLQAMKMREQIDLRKRQLSRLIQQAAGSSKRVKILQQELQNAKSDMKFLGQQYDKQCIELQKQQQRNYQINIKMDQTAIQASELWARVQDQILSKSQSEQRRSNCDDHHLDHSLEHRQHARLLQIWKQIQKIIQNN